MAKAANAAKADSVSSGEQALLRKITVSDVMGKPFMKGLAKHLDEVKGKKSWLLRVVGVTNLGEPGHDEKRDTSWVRFVGDFEGTNLITGEVFRSAACILPNFIGEQIYAAIQPKEGDTSRRMAEFAFDIGAHYDDDAITKYVYDVKALRAPQASGALLTIKAALPALPAPAKA